MANRVEPRHLIRLRVNLRGTDENDNPFAQTVFTHNVSMRGARLTEVPPLLAPQSLVKVEYGRKKALFRVVWIGGKVNSQIGLLSLEPNKCIWGTPVPGTLISPRA